MLSHGLGVGGEGNQKRIAHVPWSLRIHWKSQVQKRPTGEARLATRIPNQPHPSNLTI